MSEARRGRPPQRFSIRRVRLVGFHNFVDETVTVEGGGHLFLLGDNGSGKTTILDAIHLVLTGTHGIELNAAARVSGGREGGRTLQGIVLRYDAERGVMNAGGAVAYAVLELATEDDDATLLVGMGIEATTMDADVVRWGVLTRGRLEDLPVVDVGPEGAVPVARDALRERIGKEDVYPRLTDFRRAVADRLFGGPALYEEVCRFWSMAKAYREIVSKARDFAGLFARLLPAPNRETFADILRSARTLHDLEDVLESLDAQRRYVAGLDELCAEIRGHREAAARYRWLATSRRLAGERSARDEASARRDALGVDAFAAKAALEVARAEVHAAENALASARSADAEGLGERLRHAEAQLSREKGEHARAAAASASARAEVATAQACFERRIAERARVVSRLASAARANAEQVRDLSLPLAAVLTAIDEEQQRASVEDPPPMGALAEAAIAEIEAAVHAAEAAAGGAERDVAVAEAHAVSAREELARLEAQPDEVPQVEGFLAARRALADAGIAARPLYEMLEPKASADGVLLAAVEALASDPELAAFVVSPEDLARARAVVLAHPGARVVVRPAEGAELPEWIAALLSARTDAGARGALATILVQPAALGAVAACDARGDLEHRGQALRVHGGAPRLLGEAARRRAHEARRQAARAALERAEEELRTRRARSEEARARLGSARGLRESFLALRGQEAVELHAEARAAIDALARAKGREDLVAKELAVAESRVLDATRLVEALAARARDAHLDEIEQRIAELREREVRAKDGERSALERLVRVEEEIRSTEASLSSLDAAIRVLEAERAERAIALRLAIGSQAASWDDAALAHHVQIVQRGAQFKSVGHVEERLRITEREEAAADAEIGGDGSRGVRNLQWAGRFGFAWRSETCSIEDRRGEPLASVLAQLDRAIAEQREVVSGKTRELMESLVMGALARELQEQVERLGRTVREMNAMLGELRFGATRYQFVVKPRADREELVNVVKRVSILDEESRARFREFVEEQLDGIKRVDDDTQLPELLDYRLWFDYRLAMRTSGEGDTELTRELRALGSGGEQGVPNYLLVLALARLMFDNAGARVRPLMFDEAFYGIDSGRRDQLLRLATDLGLQLVVASPDQDGVTPSVRRTTTLFLVKDDRGDVHLAPYHYWNDTRVVQRSMLADRPEEPPPDAARCITGAS